MPRHRFVPPPWDAFAYADRPLPIGQGQTISQPFVVALMTQMLDPRPGDRVLEVGTGSGYQAAVLAELVARVHTIEILRPLGERAAALLRELGYDNVEVRIGDGYQGWLEAAPRSQTAIILLRRSAGGARFLKVYAGRHPGRPQAGAVSASAV